MPFILNAVLTVPTNYISSYFSGSETLTIISENQANLKIKFLSTYLYYDINLLNSWRYRVDIVSILLTCTIFQIPTVYIATGTPCSLLSCIDSPDKSESSRKLTVRLFCILISGWFFVCL